jgi:hypothetical protein
VSAPEPTDTRPQMTLEEFEQRMAKAFPEASYERVTKRGAGTMGGELVIYTGWVDDGDGKVLRYGERDS